MNELLDQLKNDFQSEEARYAYADSVVNALVSAQIKALREDRDLNQDKLAEMIGTRQSGISRLERTDYSSWKIDTLRRLARAFGVRLRINFEEFGTLLDDVAGFNGKKLLPRRFEDDPVFNSASAAHRRPKVRSSGKPRYPSGRRRRRHFDDISVPKKSPSQEMYRNPPIPLAVGGTPVQRAAPFGHSSLGNNSTNVLTIPMVGVNSANSCSGGV